MEITGDIRVSAVMAVIASFLVQAVKPMVPEQYHKFIPLPLAGVLIGIGVLLAFLQSADMVAGGIEGMMAAALAVFGYETVKGIVKPQK